NRSPSSSHSTTCFHLTAQFFDLVFDLLQSSVDGVEGAIDVDEAGEQLWRPGLRDPPDQVGQQAESAALNDELNSLLHQPTSAFVSTADKDAVICSRMTEPTVRRATSPRFEA